MREGGLEKPSTSLRLAETGRKRTHSEDSEKEEKRLEEEEHLKKHLGFLYHGGIVTGIITAILFTSTMTGCLSSAVGLSATAALASLFSAFVVELWRLSRR